MPGSTPDQRAEQHADQAHDDVERHVAEREAPQRHRLQLEHLDEADAQVLDDLGQEEIDVVEPFHGGPLSGSDRIR
jgi:hypothetical protein